MAGAEEIASQALRLGADPAAEYYPVARQDDGFITKHEKAEANAVKTKRNADLTDSQMDFKIKAILSQFGAKSVDDLTDAQFDVFDRALRARER